MSPATTYAAHSKRELIVHDSLAFLALLATSVVLFGVTLFLFRSFQAHRVELAQRWAARGRTALAQKRPEDAVRDLRTALSYAPEDRDDQLLLAQSLAQAGHLDEAANYFLTLWDARPGDGFINLELARLSREKNDDDAADNYYRASIYGSWEGDGVLRRREVRLELADFLIGQHRDAEARNALFTVAGNAPKDVKLDDTVAQKLEAAGYSADAYTFLEQAVAAAPRNRDTLAHAGRVAYQLGMYADAERLLRRAIDQPIPASENDNDAQRQQLVSLAQDARRIQQLTLNRDQPATQRAEHILEAAKIAQDRLRNCLSAPNSSPKNDPLLDDLTVRWMAVQPNSRTSLRTVLENASAQDNFTELIYSTEQGTVQACGQPSGDDALLLRLADAAQPAPVVEAPPQLPVQPTSTPSFTSRLFGRKAAPKNGN
jgi:tetratricopeptide (TPR) repeat protein